MNREEMIARLEEGEDALDLSIEKWENIKKTEKTVHIGFGNCALCYLYNTEVNHTPYCEGCPIYEKTGKAWCKDTPYQEYSNATYRKMTKKELEEIAQREIDFLRSLK